MAAWNKSEWSVALDPNWSDATINVAGHDLPVVTDAAGNKHVVIQGMMSEDQTMFYHKHRNRHFKLHLAQVGYTFPIKFERVAEVKDACKLLQTIRGTGQAVDWHGAPNLEELAHRNEFGSFNEMLGVIMRTLGQEAYYGVKHK